MFHIFEILMLTCFGFSWPISLYKTVKQKDASGKSCTFGIVIIAGYIFGIIGKLMQHGSGVLYWISFVVTIDTLVTAEYKYWKK